MPSPPDPPRPAPERLARLVDRTTRLHELTALLSMALRAEEVAAIVVDEGTRALKAHSGALWSLDPAGTSLLLMRATGYPEPALASVRKLPLDPDVPISDAVLRGEPVWLSSVADYEARYPVSAARVRQMAPRGYSVAALPIQIADRTIGVLALTFLDERGFDEDDRMYLQFLAVHCAQGFERARLYQSETAAKERAVFLSRASGLLGSSIDYEQTLRNVAAIAVPSIGDWCGVDLLDEDGTLKQVAVGHVDPEKVEYARELRRRYPPGPDSAVMTLLRTGTSQLYPSIPDAMLVATAVDDEHLRIMRELGLTSAMSVPIKDRDQVLGAISFVLSSTSRVYTEEDLLMAEQLGERAGAAIANARLYAAAREAIRARDDFMLVAGHELRTPLAALALHHESLAVTRDGTPLEKIRERGLKLRSQTERLGKLIEDLLDVSRLSAGRLVLELHDVTLGALVREIVERMHDELERAHVEVTLEIDDTLYGHWDRARIDQIVTNLIGNAVKYGKGAPLTIRVVRDGAMAALVVADRGIGIAAADQPRIFERFERAVSSRKFGGLGLGLWIASELVKAHRGTIEVASEPGAGATFTVRLPIAQSGY